MTDNIVEQLTNIYKILKSIDSLTTNKVSNIRKFKNELVVILNDLNLGKIDESNINIERYKNKLNNLLKTINTTLSDNHRRADLIMKNIVNHQLSNDGQSQIITGLEQGLIFFDEKTHEQSIDLSKSQHVPERGIIEQKLWKINVDESDVGYIIITDTSDPRLSSITCSQLASVLSDAPNSGCEIIDLQSITSASFISEFKESSENNLRDLTHFFTKNNIKLQNFGLTSRELCDIDILNDPALHYLDIEQREALNKKVIESGLNKNLLRELLHEYDLYSEAIGPNPNNNYSDFKRFILKDDVITCSMPLISYSHVNIEGFVKRRFEDDFSIDNRKNDGKCYIVDLGGCDNIIRSGPPNPLPPHKYNNIGPDNCYENQGTFGRYKGGQTLGLNTTNKEINYENMIFDNEIKNLIIKPMTALWKLHFGSHTFYEDNVPGVDEGKKGGKSGYYTVFAASRSPACGFMGVPCAPKHHKFGRGKDVTCIGVTAANGKSETGKKFKNQDKLGNLLDKDGKITINEELAEDINLNGVTRSDNGFGMDLSRLYLEFKKRDFIKGSDFFTIPANADETNVEDILIPDGKIIPRITNSVATLWQFNNGTLVSDGGPTGFQPGIVPFLGGTGGYTPQWHINFIHFNCGRNGLNQSPNPVIENKFSNWAEKGRNVSNSGPPPAKVSNDDPNFEKINTQLNFIGYNPNNPEYFDPVQLGYNIKGNNCPNYICENYENSINSFISISEIAENGVMDDKMLITEAPSGAQQGWIKFLIVNCPLPIQINFETRLLNN